ncbi:hypothetical protein A3A03_00820 [Candidatus Nomurabacteria bacterium RIFCSPLOWO2_01_FULL_40_18]|uniref:Uncharacterized protein n=1 Tax=Candidatus Nomurabacteria bacterium RIFCSPLOWO2_01_FULL_40_18 TaxID=1801773 RepID=A0A1F6XHT6_9BACT|nr:MAG: hypothetical protein A3A03_00820 [Candidatus Nomurabacteria bacterium RIFCSPLOWO2_01_FULL_40_18]
MEATIFLAKLWGPAILAVGLGIFVSRNYYIKIYRDLEKDALAVLVFGMMAMTAGIAHILFHNVWDTFLEGVISFFGWALLVKGALFVIVPDFVDRAGNFWVNKNLIPLAGILTIIAGIYLSWVGYFG